MRSRTLVAFCLWAGLVASRTAGSLGPADQTESSLDTILDKAGKYCQRLDKAALDFVCREEVKREDAKIETRHFKFRDILFGPSVLLGEAAAADHVYLVLKKEKVKGLETDVVACEARPGSAGRVLTGRAWVRRADGAVLRIAWDPESFSGYQDVLAVAAELRMSPAITSETEFGVERNGLRFPSLDKTDEVYKKGSMTFTRSYTTVKYTDYKFFTVETTYEVGRG